ncbi:MAG: twin-arginine translocase TatA/TatE family subunit [Ignavibacteria bacterium]|jgi:sec-independent protein translocase protein TatA
MFGLGTGEIIIIILVITLLFGAKKIPQLARSLGNSLSEFKKGAKDIENDVDSTDEEAKKIESKKS